MNRVTILIPNYNNAPFIESCLKSIQNQSYQEFTILIVDDGSTDESVHLINKFSDKRIKLVLKEKNSGIVDTLNVGLNQIETEFILRMDADDIMQVDRVAKLIQFMDKNPSIGICGSGIQQFGIKNDTIIYEKSPLQNKANLIFSHTIGHATCIFRTHILKENNIKYSNGYQYLEDYKLFYDLSKYTSMTSIPDLLYLYRQESYNQESVYFNIKKGSFIKLYNEILTDLKIDSNQNRSTLHFEINKNTTLSYPYKSYNDHLSLLINQNNLLGVFPKQEFIKTITQKRNIVQYRFMSQNKISFFEAIPFLLKSPTKLIYFFKTRKLNARKKK